MALKRKRRRGSTVLPPPNPQTPGAKRKFKKVMGEFKRGTLHHGTSGRMVPEERRDIAIAIAARQAREAEE